MKALVLCAGRGSRLRPLTHTRAKAALPVAGRPVLLHILQHLWGHGIHEVGVVIGPQQEDLRRLIAALDDQRVQSIVQRHPRGIAHAVQVARPFLKTEPFLLYLGDNLTDEDLSPALERFAREEPAALVTLRAVTNPEAFGVAEVEGDFITRVVEKPQSPVSNLAIAGIYLFQPEVHEAIATLQPSARGELEITDAIDRLLAWNRPVMAHQISGWWQDMGSVEGILAANALLLDQIATRIDPDAVLDGVRMQGRVVVEPGAVVRQSRLRGPLVIGAGSAITDAYIGPYTSVGQGAQIAHAAVENSILLPGCRLEGPSLRLEDSLVGSSTGIWAREGRSVSLLVGDDSHLLIPPDRR